MNKAPTLKSFSFLFTLSHSFCFDEIKRDKEGIVCIQRDSLLKDYIQGVGIVLDY